MKRKPKFKVGQVICEKTTGAYRRIYSRDEGDDGSIFYALLRRDGVDFHYQGKNLRPLTKRERGPSRPVSQGGKG